MKDFRGIDLQVGDKVAYVTRVSSSMHVNETEILEIKEVKENSWSDKTIEVIVVKNPHWKPSELRNKWDGNQRTKLTLRIPQYIIKL